MAGKISNSTSNTRYNSKKISSSSSKNNFQKATNTIKDNQSSIPIITISNLQKQIDNLQDRIDQVALSGVLSWVGLAGHITLAQSYIALLVGQANGIATLDASGQIPVAQLPYDLMEFMGGWDASGGTTPAPPAVTNRGNTYIITVAGTIGAEDYYAGDLIVSSGTTWFRVQGSLETFLKLTDTPSSYAGQALKGLRVNAGQTGLEYVDLFIEVNPLNTIYVSKGGNDANDGLTLNRAKLTISNATSFVLAIIFYPFVFCKR